MNKFAHNICVREFSNWIKSWLEKNSFEEINKFIEKNGDLAKEVIKPHFTKSNLEQIPPVLRSYVVNNIPENKNKIVNDVLETLSNNHNYCNIIEINRKYLKDNLLRALNLLVITIRNKL